MVGKVFRNHTVISTLISLVYVSLAIPISEAVAFSAPTDAAGRHFAYLTKAIFFVVAFCITRLIFYLVSNRKKFSPFTKWWLRYGLLCFAIVFLIFILLYPGHWVWDEFNILNEAKHYHPDGWQSIFTNIYYTLCLYIYPTGVSIVFFQIVIIAIVMGYLLAVVRKYIHTPWLVYLLLLVFISPVMLINDLYPLRLTIYSYLELAFLTLLVDSYLDKSIRENKFLFIVSSFLIMFLCFWRSEGIFYILTLPIAAQRFSIIRGIRKLEFPAFICLTGALIIFASGYLVNKHYSSSRYILPVVVNPLSVMLQSPLKGPAVKSDLQKINQVLDINLVKKESSYTEVPSYWDGAVRTDYSQHLTGFYSAYLDLVIHNPESFIKARIQTFLATNSLDSNTTNANSMGLLSYKQESASPLHQAIVDNFYNSNIESHPFSYNVRYNISHALLMLDSNDYISKLGRIIWSVIPTVVLLLALVIFFIIKRLWVFLGVCVLLIAHTTLLFLTAPASYFMYYIPIYLCGGVLVILVGIHFYKRFSEKTIRSLQKLL